MKEVYHILSVVSVLGLGSFLAYQAMHKGRRAEMNKPYLKQMGEFGKEITKAERLLFVAIMLVCSGGMLI